MSLPEPMTTKEMIKGYAEQTVHAIHLMYQNRHFGQLLVLLYSAIDSMGLLDAPPGQVSANGTSFKAWVRKYLLPQDSSLEFNEVDLWAARCGVLHTHTTHSDLSRTASAKQIQYHVGDKNSAFALAFVEATRQIDDGAHVPAHLESTLLAFYSGLELFLVEMEKNCASNPVYQKRMSQVLQNYRMPR